MNLREAAQQAFEAMGKMYAKNMDDFMDCMTAYVNLQRALEEPEQKPVAYVTGAYAGHFIVVPTNPALVLTTGMALYTHPPQRKPLTDEEIDALPWTKNYESDVTLYEALREFARAIERAHGIIGEMK